MAGSESIISTVVYAFQQSDPVARTVVFILLILSGYAWTVMLEKGLALRNLRRRNNRFHEDFISLKNAQQMNWLIRQHSGPLAEVADTGRAERLEQVGVSIRRANQTAQVPELAETPTEGQAESVRDRMARHISRHIRPLEDRLNVLGTIVSISPFLGLLGTVWGVMRAFTGMAVAGSTDIQVMAPGVSGALLTTVVGLLVAIPAVVGYNLLTQAVQQQVREMDDFVEDFMYLLRNTSETTTVGNE